MALSRVWIPSPNYSSRGGAVPRLIVLHTAEGALTYQALGNFFANKSSGVSSHVGIDDTPNTVGEYVSPGNKAWTAANANPVAVQAELCAFASWSTAEWHNHSAMLSNATAWVAEESARFGIPLRRLSASEAQTNGHGICEHRDLGAWGGNHSDCGNSFPIDDVITAAAGGIQTPSARDETGAMDIRTTKSGEGYWLCASDGGVFCFGDAPFLGSMGGQHLNAPVVGMDNTNTDRGYILVAKDGGVFTFGDAGFYGALAGQPLNAPIQGIEFTPSNRGYWMLGQDGGVFSFGDAGFYGAATGKVAQ